MQLLTWLSLGYAAILVLALAGSLILILVQLWRVRRALQPVAEALVEVADHTRPLQEVVGRLVQILETVQEDAGAAADATVRAGGALGIAPPQPPIVQAHAAARWQEVVR